MTLLWEGIEKFEGGMNGKLKSKKKNNESEAMFTCKYLVCIGVECQCIKLNVSFDDYSISI